MSRAKVADPKPAPSRSARLRFSTVAAIAAAAALVVGAVAWSVWDSTTSETTPSAVNPSPLATSLEGHLLLVSGQVSQGSAPLGLGEKLRPGVAISSSKGNALLGMDPGVSVMMAGGTRLRLTRMETDGIDLELCSGQVIIQVDPSVDSPPLTVSTDDGEVAVTGTVFSVTVLEGMDKVRVFRGSVETTDITGHALAVRAGEETRFAAGRAVPFDQEFDDEADNVLRAMEILAAGECSAVELDSVPRGAQVFVDGVALGATPMSALIRSGHRKLEVRKPHHESVTELVELRVAGKLTRTFELSPFAVASLDTQEDTEPEKGEKKPRAKSSKPTLTAQEMLAGAQKLRREREWSKALDAYNLLIRTYPTGSEAKASLVSVGNIHLEKLGAPAKALAAFDRYLESQRSGALAEEAAFGRARALRALGRTDEERAALQAFLAAYPNTIKTQRVIRRLDELK